ncbi:hypothetical protein ACFSUI_01760 [Ralstonia solanacearum]
MKIDESGLQSEGRRRFLHAGVATAGAAWLPATGAIGQTSAKYRRVNVNDPVRGPQVLASYKKAIKAMLALPPTDPRNWYRIALTHTLDCPHGNCSAPYRRTAFPGPSSALYTIPLPKTAVVNGVVRIRIDVETPGRPSRAATSVEVQEARLILVPISVR